MNRTVLRVNWEDGEEPQKSGLSLLESLIRENEAVANDKVAVSIGLSSAKALNPSSGARRRRPPGF